MIKIFTLLFLGLLGGCSLMDADEINDLRDMNKLSQEYKDISFNCLIEMKFDKATGWDSERCELYKKINKIKIQNYTYNVKLTTAAFNRYAKSKNTSPEDIKVGLEQALLLETNLDTIKKHAKTIQLSLKK